MKLKDKIICVLGIVIVIIIGIIFLTNSKKEELVPSMVIDNKIESIKVGDNYKLYAHVENYSNALIKWSSSNSNILTVDSGLITAKEAGTAIITAYYKHTDGINYEDKYSITVIDDSIDLLSIDFKEGDLLMRINNTFDINSIIEKKPLDGMVKSSIYKSSNTSVLIVDDSGIAKCNNVGKSIITVEYNERYTIKKDVYCINEKVNANLVINPTKIIANDVDIKIGEAKQIVYTLTPSNALSDYLTFTSSNSSIVSVDEKGRITGIKEGTATIKISALNGVESIATITVKSNVIAVQSITLSRETIELKTGEKTEVDVIVNPSNATNKNLSIESNNIGVAIGYIENNKLIIAAIKDGDAIIKVKCDNITKQIIVNVKTSATPNPTTDPYTTPPIPVIITNPTITSTGTIDNSLLSGGTETGFNSCRSASPNLTLKVNGTTIGQDGSATMKVGQSIKLTVYLPTKCGQIVTLTRTSADGSSNWGNYFYQSNNPHVDRYDKNTYLSGVQTYQWTITALKKGSSTLSQTAQFDVKSPSGKIANIKSMIRFRVKVVE